jgi:hypothetical protein
MNAGSAGLGCLLESRPTRHHSWPTHRRKSGAIAIQKHPRSNIAFEADRLDADPKGEDHPSSLREASAKMASLVSPSRLVL